MRVERRGAASPAIHGKLRRPAGQTRGQATHGRRSTGPRTAEGIARPRRAARTVHGAYSAETRAFNRYGLTALRRGQVGNVAVRCVDRLPQDFFARLMRMPPDLLPPPWPSGGLTPAQDRAMLRAEADALAPWRAAIAQAGLARWAGSAGPALGVGRPGASAEAHAPERRPAASDAISAALPNRAARRRWKSLQRRLQPAPAACSHP